MSNNDSKRHFEPYKKFEIIKEVIIGKTHKSARDNRINTGQSYKWQQAFLNGAIAGLRQKKTAREVSPLTLF